VNNRAFGSGKTPVSEIGLGCWQIGGADWGSVTDAEALEILAAAFDSGTTFFDTADVYGLGRSEELVGRFLKKTSLADAITVATKMGRFPEPGWPGNFTAEAMRAHTEASLKRLQVGALDLTQLHCIPTEVLRRGEVFETLRALLAEGKIKQFGVSVESMEEAHLCLDQQGVSSLQIIFNMIRQKPAEVLFERAQTLGVSLIVRLPLASGLLAGKYSRDTTFAEQDHRNYNRDGAAFNVGETFAGIPFEKAVEIVELLRPFVPAGMTMAQMALRWCLDFEAVTVVIPGARSAAMARANAAASALPPLEGVTHAAIREIYHRYAESAIRGPY